MSFWLALLLLAVGVFLLAAVTVFVIGLIGSQRRITKGPLVVAARVLFVLAVVMLGTALVSLVVGLATSWA